MKIGVLAVQGAFIEHIDVLKKLGAEPIELRQKRDLDQEFDGLILPGGESTVMGKLLRELDMLDDIKRRISSGLPVLGTCAGLILLANRLSNDRDTYFATMDITVKRNAYGRQLGSFHTVSEFKGVGEIPMTFIRAPYIESAGNDVQILAEIDGKPVAAKQGNQLVTAFHPELTKDLSVHKYFLSMAKKSERNNGYA